VKRFLSVALPALMLAPVGFRLMQPPAASGSGQVAADAPKGFSRIHMRRTGPYPDGGPGRAMVIPSEPRVSESEGNQFRIEYEVGTGGIAAGGGIRISLFDSAGARGSDYATQQWSRYQTQNPAMPGFTTASATRESSRVELNIVDGADLEAVALVRGEPLRQGDRIRIERSGVKAPILARRYRFPVRVDPQGNGQFREIGEWPGLQVIGQRAARFHVILPSWVGKGEKLPLRVVAIDQHGNPDHRFPGEVEVAGAGVLASKITITGTDRGAKTIPDAVQFSEPGFYYLSAKSGTVEGESNPVRVEAEKPPYRIYWGDTHTHTVFSDGTYTIDEQYEYARDVASLDFGGASDHDTNFFRKDFPDFWQDTLRAAEQWNQPGKFLTLPGYEWSRPSGHRNVYYFDPPDAVKNAPLVEHQTPDKLWASLDEQGGRIITAPHHVAGAPAAVDWNYKNAGQKLDRIAEVYSVHGSGEYPGNPLEPARFFYGSFLQDGFAKGHKLGMIGSGDWHEAALGHLMDVPRYPRRAPYAHFRSWGGIGAVYSSELTRRGLYEALYQRRAYATTNRRIFLDVRVDGHWLGEEFRTAGHPKIHVRAAGTTNLARVDVVRDNRVIYQGSIYLNSQALDVHDQEWNDKLAFQEPMRRRTTRARADETRIADFSFIDRSFNPPAGGSHWYYVRVTQRDGTMAWSSPVWVGRQ
jgi:hypothetical protein